MSKTTISWCEFSVNPIRYRNLETGKVGHYCDKVSAGCKNCYSSQMQKGPYLSGLEFIASNKGKGEHFFEPKVLEQVIARRKPTEYFWCDMTDLFGDWVPTAWIAKCFAAMFITPLHTHITLTKRPQRMCELVNLGEFEDLVSGAVADLVAMNGAIGSLSEWPPPNWVAGTSCENQAAADERIPWLLQTPAETRIVSAEPLLGPIGLEHYFRSKLQPGNVWADCLCDEIDPADKPCVVCFARMGLDGVIIGGESGPNALPCNVEWIRSIVGQCKEANVKCFCKQMGSNYIDELGDLSKNRNKGADMLEWPSDIKIRELPWRTQP